MEFDGDRYFFADQVQLELTGRDVLDTTQVVSVIEPVAHVVVPVVIVAVGWWLWWRRRVASACAGRAEWFC